MNGLGKFSTSDLQNSLPFCTHLLYGYADIDENTNELKIITGNLNIDETERQLNSVIDLKKQYPNLKIYLSVGGGAKDDEYQKYLTFLESNQAQLIFKNRITAMLRRYKFDGLDLSWRFPTIKPKKIKSGFGKLIKGIKTAFGLTGSIIDEKSDEHREQFTAFLRDLKYILQNEKYELSLTVLPNIDSSLYFHIPSIIEYLDFVNLAVFDFQTPERVPKEADYPSPIYQPEERNEKLNINYQVQYWLTNKCPSSKLIMGLPSFGRVWKMTSDSSLTGVPPIPDTENDAPKGQHIGLIGKYSWPEVCSRLPNINKATLKGDDAPLKINNDPSKRYGKYGYRIPDDDGNYGMWIGYDDPDVAARKTDYAIQNKLGGIALFDLTLDDFRGTCTGDKFPILRAAVYKLRLAS